MFVLMFAADSVIQVLPSASSSQDVLSSGVLNSDSVCFVNCETTPLPLDFWVENSNDSYSVEIPIVPELNSFLYTNRTTVPFSTEADFSSVAMLPKAACDMLRDAADGDDDDDDDYHDDDDSILDPTFSSPSSVSSSDDESDVTLSGSAVASADKAVSNIVVMSTNHANEAGSAVASADEAVSNIVVMSTNNGNEAGSAVASPDEAASNIVVMSTNNANRRKYDKAAYCYYCKMPQTKLSRHLKKKHSTEQDVECLLAEENPTERNIALMKLRNLGNHHHNVAVVREQKGDFIVAYRPKDEGTDYRQYITCRYCYGYFVKDSMWKHLCPLAPKTADGKAIPRLRKGVSNQLSTGSAST